MKTRGEEQVCIFEAAMLNELRCNAHKGPWTSVDVPTAIHEILYHTAKLALALQDGEHPEAVLEYAADVANGAMFAAHAHGALDESMIRDGHAEDFDAPWRTKLPRWKLRTRGLAQVMVGGSPRKKAVRAVVRDSLRSAWKRAFA